jgi:hypothetical protein
MVRTILVLAALLGLAACGTTKKTMKNCEATPDPKVFVNCEEMD